MSEGFGGGFSRSPRAARLLLHGCISKGVSATAGAQRIALVLLGERARGDALSARLGFFTLDTSQGCHKAHGFGCCWVQKPLPPPCRGHLSHCSGEGSQTRGFLGSAQPCGVVRTANSHHPQRSEDGCVRNVPGSQGDTGLLTTSSVFTQDQGKGVTSPKSSPVAYVGASPSGSWSFFQLSLLPVNPGWLLLGRSDSGGLLVPVRLPNCPTAAATADTVCPCLLHHAAPRSRPGRCCMALEPCCPARRGTPSQTGLTSPQPLPVTPEDRFPVRGNAPSLQRYTSRPAVNDTSSARAEPL